MRRFLSNFVRWLLMPGFDLFTRRRTHLCRHWAAGPRRVLDAGSGNGWFSYLAYRSGASVTAVNFAEDQVQKAVRFYNEWLGVSHVRLDFRVLNLYDLDCLDGGFDEIICYETLEHVKGDDKVCALFWKLLRPGGALHLCCPNADHPRWRGETLDPEEKGYHVRAGYTLESYRRLLEPIGFRITGSEGVGGPVLVWAVRFLQRLRGRFGDVAAAPLALLAFPLVGLDRGRPGTPYCVYVCAVKPTPAL